MIKKVTLPADLTFDWDEANLRHIKKHDVEYEECEEAFFNRPFLVDKDIGHSQKEERFQALGKTNLDRMIFIIFTFRKEKIRVISARDQSRKERITYKGGGINET